MHSKAEVGGILAPSYKQPSIDIHKDKAPLQGKPLISEPRKSSQQPKPLLSFLPAGRIRSVAEYLVAAAAGAILLFLFFMASEAAVLLMRDTPLMPITFVPVICLLPILAGALAAIALEKLRAAQIGIKRGAAVGALSGFFGALVSSVPLLALDLLNMSPLGEALAATPIVLAVLLVTIVLDTLLSALGGALVVKFIS